jgi:hypothetical protein
MKEPVVENVPGTKRLKKSISTRRPTISQKIDCERSHRQVYRETRIKSVTAIIERCILYLIAFVSLALFSSKHSLSFQVDIGTSSTTTNASTRPLPPLSNQDKDAHHGHYSSEGSMMFVFFY